MHKSTYVQEVSRILASMDKNGSQEPQDSTQPETSEKPEAFDVYVEEDRITVVKRPEPQPQVIEAVQPPQRQSTSPSVAYTAMMISLLLLLYLVTAAFTTIFFPPVVTIMIMPKSQTISLTGTVQLGRLLPPITISQSQTVPTTGKGHQDAKAATGIITFYNGLFSSQTMHAGTVLTGADGVQIITDQDALIPEAYPPNLGYATVSAHATHPGSNGNIHAYDINQACCATAIKAVNTTAFHGGLDERYYQTVAGQDINNAASPLKVVVSVRMHGALQSHIRSPEALELFPCTPTTTTDHQPGQEATQVTVTVSETCSSIAYDTQTLETNVTALLTTQAIKKLGAGYSILENPHITVTHATPAKRVMLSFTSVSTWVYALTFQEQNHIKKIIAGKTKEQALQRLYSLPGTEQVSIHFAGFGDATSIPKNLSNIHLTIIYGV